MEPTEQLPYWPILAVFLVSMQRRIVAVKLIAAARRAGSEFSDTREHVGLMLASSAVGNLRLLTLEEILKSASQATK